MAKAVKWRLPVSCSKCDKSTVAEFQFAKPPVSAKVKLKCDHCKKDMVAIAHVDTYLIRGK